MNIFDRDIWQEIFATMRKNKLRTTLTALGVFWGIFMLVTLLGLGKGFETGVYRDFGSRAKNIMFVWSWTTSLPYNGYAAGRRVKLDLSDIEVLRNRVKEIDMIAPRNEIGPFAISYKGNSENYEVRGEFTDFPKIEAINIYKGRYINQSDIDEGRKVVAIGNQVQEVLYGEADPVGTHLRIKGIDFQVVGVYGPEKKSDNNNDHSESVVIPLTTMERAFGTGGEIGWMAISAKPGFHVSDMEDKVRSILKELNDVDPEDAQGIGGFNLEKEFQQVQSLFLGIKIFLWIVGIGTLLAGIIGVSNIMLIIVKERTKEIGIRKALGATPKSIISLILIESIFITSISGYVGVVIGTLMVWGIDAIMIANDVDVQNFWHPQVNFYVALASVVTLVIAGTIAGLIPALQASKVNPVEALKDE